VFCVKHAACQLLLAGGDDATFAPSGGYEASIPLLHNWSCRLSSSVPARKDAISPANAKGAEFVLSKERILEIYLNVVEWGPGIYGAESACRYYDETAARNIGRQQAARLAAILPAPQKRRPGRMINYSAIILGGWAKCAGNRG
jgi:Transglycosylase